MDLYKIAVWITMAVCLYVAVYLIHKRAAKKNVFFQIYKKAKTGHEERIRQEAGFVSKYGEIENKSLLYKVDRLLLASGMKKYVPHLTGEGYLIFLMLSFPVAAYLAFTFTKNMLFSLFLGAAVVTGEILTVVILSGKTYKRIEEDTPLFVSVLNNHAKSSTDIVTIFTRTLASLDGPIKRIVSDFLVNAEKYGNVDQSFDYACESVDNRTLKTIFVNLKNCMHYQANYEEVLTQMMGQITESMSAREERKNILFSMKLTLISISVMSVIIVALIGKGIGVDVKGILTENLAGQCILFFTGILYLFVTIKVSLADR